MEPKDEIKQRLDVADVVGDYLTLKPAGSGSFKAVCPFHAEKTPSFYVSKEKQIWHCFGCDKGGDLISFVMEIEGMSFPEALRHLGKKAGVEIPEYRPSKESDEKEFLISMNELAGKFYEAILWNHDEGKVAREYLASRGIDEELAKSFRLGCAPDRWDALKNALAKKGFDESRMLKAGLVKKRQSGNGSIDRFRGRLMIPLCDARGRMLGFTGRLLVEQGDKTGPKYLNSPETAVYHKSDVIFGLDLARSAIRQEASVIIVEGNLDVVASHKAGIKNVVASSGTALTESQLLQLKKLTTNLIFSFDGDNAGYNAARRGIHLAQKMGFRVQVIAIPDELGKDPDDVVQKNPEAWKELVTAPKHIMEYYFARALKGFDATSVDSKRELAHFMTEEIARLSDPVEREHWMQRLADVIQVELSVVKQLLDKQGRPEPQTAPEKKPAAPPKPQEKKITSRVDQAAAFLLGLALYDHQLVEDVIARLPEESLPEQPWRRVYKELVLLYTSGQNVDPTQKSFFSQLRDTLQSSGAQDDLKIVDAAVMRVERAVGSLSRDQVREELNRHLDILSDASQEARKKQLVAAIRQAERTGDSSRVKALMEEYSKLL